MPFHCLFFMSKVVMATFIRKIIFLYIKGCTKVCRYYHIFLLLYRNILKVISWYKAVIIPLRYFNSLSLLLSEKNTTHHLVSGNDSPSTWPSTLHREYRKQTLVYNKSDTDWISYDLHFLIFSKSHNNILRVFTHYTCQLCCYLLVAVDLKKLAYLKSYSLLSLGCLRIGLSV